MEMPIPEALPIISADEWDTEEAFDEGLFVTETESLYEETVSRSMIFSQEEIEDPNIWYAIPDRVVTLAAAPAGTAYTRSLVRCQELEAEEKACQSVKADKKAQKEVAHTKPRY